MRTPDCPSPEPRLPALGARLWRDHARGEWRSLLVVLVLMGLVSLATGLYPLVIDWAYRLFEGRDGRVVWLVPSAAVAVVAVKALAQYAQTVAMQAVVLRIILSLQVAMFDRLLSADLARLQAEPPARLASRFTNDMGVVREALGRAVSGVVDALTVLALIVAMLWLDWVMTLAAAAAVPLAVLPIARIGRRMRKASRAQQEQAGEVTAVLAESLAGARLVKAYGLEALERRRAGEAFGGWYTRLMKVVRNRARVDPLLEAMGGVAVAAVIAFAGWRIASGAASAGQFTGFVAALLIAARPLRALGTLAVALQEGAAALARAFAVIDERPTVVDRPQARPLALGPGRIEFRSVSFRYGDGRPALERIDLVIEPGTTVALVGPSGAGKTSLLNLVPRFADPTTGAVLIDGQDLRDVTFASLREAIGFVGQEVVLFDDTVAANIRLGRLEATDEEVERAARLAEAHGFIAALPQGYATRVGDRGLALSGGQRQRIALARALLRNPRILLLDEATSALDLETEARIRSALGQIRQGRTTLIVAHRLSTVREADRIVVLEGGRVVEDGNHASLLAEGGTYARLVSSQAFLEEPIPAAAPGR